MTRHETSSPVAYYFKRIQSIFIRIIFISQRKEQQTMGVFQSSLTFDREKISTDGGVKYEGYWASKEDKASPFPFPVGSDTPWPGKEEFLTKLRAKQEKAEVISYRGYSHCRLVGKNGCAPEPGYNFVVKNNGASEYKMVTANGDVIHWPEGYEHYIEVHNVKPSREFYNFIMN